MGKKRLHIEGNLLPDFELSQCNRFYCHIVTITLHTETHYCFIMKRKQWQDCSRGADTG